MSPRAWTPARPKAQVALGRYYTEGSAWLLPQVLRFVAQSRPRLVLDPFAGLGHLLEALKPHCPAPQQGFDLEAGGRWGRNDSLRTIPAPAGTLIATNPPYLSNYSARRRGVLGRVKPYFDAEPGLDDLYLIALKRCLEAADRVLAIVPETFLGSAFPKDRLDSFTILLESPFADTACPVGVACFCAAPGRQRVYAGAKRLGSLAAFEAMRLRPRGTVELRFNDPQGQLAIQAVDLARQRIAFLPADQLGYDRANIKPSSRLVTTVGLPAGAPAGLAGRCNRLLEAYRRRCQDVLLSPFKGNNALGQRRRRLDYGTARAIIELALSGKGQAPKKAASIRPNSSGRSAWTQWPAGRSFTSKAGKRRFSPARSSSLT